VGGCRQAISLIETHVTTSTSNHPEPSAVSDGCGVSDDKRTSEDSSDDKSCISIVCTDEREGVFKHPYEESKEFKFLIRFGYQSLIDIRKDMEKAKNERASLQ
jgi:hypothetical protein